MSGSQFEAVAGYARVVKDGPWAFSAGTTGFDYKNMTISDDIVMQTLKAVENIKVALKDVGFLVSDVIQCNWVITDRDYFVPCGKILSDFFEETRPAMMTMVCQLIDPRMKFEMQVIALKRASADQGSEIP